MSIKQQAIDAITDMLGRTPWPDQIHHAVRLVNQLQEPQAVRVAPELPEAGQAFHYKFKGEWVLAVVVECRVNGLRVQDAFSGGHRPLSIIGEWLPVVPPTFPKEGV